MTEQRRLAAILVADVVGYSKLMGSDEAGTLAQLEALRTEIIEPQIAKHAGRLFKSVGDGFLIEFGSAVQAVSCAKAIQDANDLGRLPLRIGIHVGDVVVQGDDLMGDGVNVAARIEGIADPGGIAITRAVHEQCATARSWLHGQGRGRVEEHPAACADFRDRRGEGRRSGDRSAITRQAVDCRAAVPEHVGRSRTRVPRGWNC
jgi:class 3 adenylate cyclase